MKMTNQQRHAHREANKIKKRDDAFNYSIAFNYQSLEDGFVFIIDDKKVNLIKEET